MRFSRQGAALVEFTICLPVFCLIAMATIETCRMIYLRQSIKIAAYECARLGVVPGVTADVLKLQCDAILLGRNVRGYEFSCDPADLSELKFGDLLTTSVRVSADRNSSIGSFIYRGRTFRESVSIMVEY
jgi:hypothetical protein